MSWPGLQKLRNSSENIEKEREEEVKPWPSLFYVCFVYSALLYQLRVTRCNRTIQKRYRGRRKEESMEEDISECVAPRLVIKRTKRKEKATRKRD
jgi:hypothetical protein